MATTSLYSNMQRLRPDQRAALDGLRSAHVPIGTEGFRDMQLGDASENMVADNEQQTRNALTTLATPTQRRQHLNMTPNGEVYYPTPSTMMQGGMARVYGDVQGQGYETSHGLGQLGSTDWAGFNQHYEDRDRMRKSVPNVLAGLRGAARGGGGY